MFMKLLKLIGNLLALLVLLVFALILYSAVIYPMYLESQAEMGMDRDEVLGNFEGMDYQLSETLTFCENGAWHGDCGAAGESSSVEWLTLKTGIDTWIVVGFDGAGKVAFVGSGDT